jgi:hypothetical protein
VVDWASPTPLRTALRLEPAAAAVVGFIEVPEAMAQAAAPGMPFYVTLAVNVGVRRARGRFVALGDSDCLYTAVTLSNLLSLLEGRTDPSLDVERLMMPLRRYQVPWEFVHRQPDIPTLERYLRIAFNAFRTEMTGAGLMGGFAGAQLMHRDIWMRVRGYNEALTAPWGWGDNELHIRVNQHHGWLDPAYYGVALFHLEHHSVHRPKSGARVPNKMLIEAGFVANGPDWGLGGQDLPVRRAEPGAAEEVPPLLPLSGRFADLDRAALQAERTDVRAVTETCLRHFRDALAAGGPGRVPPDVTIGLMRTLVAFCCVGTFTINSNSADLAVLAFFTVFGYICLKLGCEPAPLILGFVLGPMMEENLRRALLISRGDPAIFLSSPISIGFLLAAAFLLVVVAAPTVRRRRDEAMVE